MLKPETITWRQRTSQNGCESIAWIKAAANLFLLLKFCLRETDFIQLDNFGTSFSFELLSPDNCNTHLRASQAFGRDNSNFESFKENVLLMVQTGTLEKWKIPDNLSSVAENHITWVCNLKFSVHVLPELWVNKFPVVFRRFFLNC